MSAVDDITSEHLIDLGEVVQAAVELQLWATDFPQILVEDVQLSNSPGASLAVAKRVPPEISPTQPLPPPPSEVAISTSARAEVHITGQVSVKLPPVGALEEQLPPGQQTDGFSHPTHDCGVPMKRPASPDDMDVMTGDSFSPSEEAVEGVAIRGSRQASA